MGLSPDALENYVLVRFFFLNCFLIFDWETDSKRREFSRWIFSSPLRDISEESLHKVNP